MEKEIESKNETISFESKRDKQNLRRLNLLQKGGLFQPQPSDVSSKRATTVTELRDAYHLVHKIFLEQNFILPNRSKLRVRPWETSPDTATFISKRHNEIVGVFSSIMDSRDLLLPSDKSFGPELNVLRDSGAILCEMTNQAVVPEFRNTAISTELMQCVFAQAWHNDVTDLVCAISPKQLNFFGLMGFTQIGEIKSYSDVVDDPVALMRLADIQNCWTYDDINSDSISAFWKRFFITENHYMTTVPLWQAMSDMFFKNSEQIAALFTGCEELFENATYDQRIAMERRLGAATPYFSHSRISSMPGVA